MKVTHTTNKLGAVKTSILQHLQKNGRSKILDMEMAMGRGGLRVAIQALIGQGYVVRSKDVAFDGVKITNAGRTAIGLSAPEKAPLSARICNAMMRGTYEPAIESHMGRIGLARIGVAERVCA